MFPNYGAVGLEPNCSYYVLKFQLYVLNTLSFQHSTKGWMSYSRIYNTIDFAFEIHKFK